MFIRVAHNDKTTYISADVRLQWIRRRRCLFSINHRISLDHFSWQLVSARWQHSRSVSDSMDACWRVCIFFSALCLTRSARLSRKNVLPKFWCGERKAENLSRKCHGKAQTIYGTRRICSKWRMLLLIYRLCIAKCSLKAPSPADAEKLFVCH